LHREKYAEEEVGLCVKGVFGAGCKKGERIVKGRKGKKTSRWGGEKGIFYNETDCEGVWGRKKKVAVREKEKTSGGLATGQGVKSKGVKPGNGGRNPSRKLSGSGGETGGKEKGTLT